MKRINSARSLIKYLGAAALCGWALFGCANVVMAARLVDVTVINRNTGERLTPYRYDGKLYVAGAPGDPYSVELRSRNGERLLTVLSVDGVNVLTGQTADTLQSGYVLEDRRSYAISGWRKSMDDVAKFVFTDLPDSYAARTGRPGNVGVIGVAVYREKAVLREPIAVAPAPMPSMRTELSVSVDGAVNKTEAIASGAMAERRDLASPEAMKKAKQLGTGHGEREYAPTRYTDFVRSSDSPDEIVTIYYDSRSNLLARGIIPAPRVVDPKPFPGGFGFVPDPRG